MFPGALALWAALFLAGSPAWAQTHLVPGYADRPARGSSAASGAIIYSHGLAEQGEAAGETPFVVDAFQEAGWDVYRLQRSRAQDTLDSATAALVDAMHTLQGQGYRRLILVGHSFGGWISLAAARPENGLVDGVIALAPAAFGRRDQTPTWPYNASALYALAEAATARRVAVFLFPDDPFEPGGRGDALREIFAQRHVDGAVIEQLSGRAGHEAPLTGAFGRRFGPCLRDYIANTHPQPMLACGEAAPPAPAAFGVPDDVWPPARPTGLAGRWYGAYENGREVLLGLQESSPGIMDAVYAFGSALRRPGDEPGYTQRRGTLDSTSGIVRFTEVRASSIIECRLLDGDHLELAFATRGGTSVLYTILRRID